MWKYARQLVKQAEGIIAPDADEPQGPSHGFRVLHVEPDSMAHAAGVEALFDYIIAVNGRQLQARNPSAPVAADAEQVPAQQLVDALQDTNPVRITLWSAKGRQTRVVDLPVRVPSETSVAGAELADAEKTAAEAAQYGGFGGSSATLDFGLGVTVQWTPTTVADYVWHVLKVAPGSPAEAAGLISHADYIVGAEDGMLEHGGEGLLGRVVTRVASDPLRDGSVSLVVYNHDYDTVRPVRIVPTEDAQGNRLMGCGVGYGLLHRLPKVEGSLPLDGTGLMPPGHTLYEDSRHTGASIVEEGTTLAAPAAPKPEAPTAPTPAPTPGGPAPGIVPPPGRPRHHGHAARTRAGASADLSSYFDEETARSNEVDGRRSANPTTVPPPPPKKK